MIGSLLIDFLSNSRKNRQKKHIGGSCTVIDLDYPIQIWQRSSHELMTSDQVIIQKADIFLLYNCIVRNVGSIEQETIVFKHNITEILERWSDHLITLHLCTQTCRVDLDLRSSKHLSSSFFNPMNSQAKSGSSTPCLDGE